MARKAFSGIAALALAILACFHLAKGFHSLVYDVTAAGDMNWRYQEIHLFWNSPMDAGQKMPLPAVERWDKGNYLPSSQIIGTLFIPPLRSWTAVRYYYAAVNALALAAVVMAAVAFSRNSGLPSWLLTPAILACSNLQSTLARGQYGIIVLALLSWAVLAAIRGKKGLGILLLSLATVKPVLCLPFFVGLAMYRQWKMLLGPSLIAGGILLAGLCLGDEPASVHLWNYSHVSLASMSRGYGLNSVLIGLGIPLYAINYLSLAAVVLLFWVLALTRPALFTGNPLVFLGLACFTGQGMVPVFCARQHHVHPDACGCRR